MAAAISGRESFLSLAELCKEFGDHSNMSLYMSELVKSIEGAELTIEERETFFDGTKMMMDFHRKRIDEVELETKTDAERWALTDVERSLTDAQRALIPKYLLRLYAEVERGCKTILATNSMLIRAHSELRRNDDSPNDKYLEPLVLYYLHEADLYRYISEFYISERKWEVYIPNSKRDDGGCNADHARQSYQFAWDNARKLATLDIEKIHIMLRVALKFSVFCSDIVSSPQESVDMANEALEAALPKMLRMSLTSRDHSRTSIKMLDKNLPIWISAVKKKQAPGSSSSRSLMERLFDFASSRKEA